MTADPLRRFEAEHAEALGVLRELEHAALALEQGEAPDRNLAVARRAHEFVSTVVRAHNEAEELALFPLIIEEAPVWPFAEEHHTLRELERDLLAALDGPEPATRVPPAARQLIALLRTHIEREDMVLFPMARALLGPEGLQAVAERLP